MGYLSRVLFALAVMVFCAVLIVRFSKKKCGSAQGSASVELIASLPVGKDVFYVLRCGPDVIALTSGNSGVRLIGRWSYEEWVRSESSGGPRGASGSGEV